MSERPSEAAGVPRARMMLQRAHWAATAFAGYDLERTRRIVDAVADAAYQNAKRYAEWAVSETGMGVLLSLAGAPLAFAVASLLHVGRFAR